MTGIRGGPRYMRAIAKLKARGEVQNCWRCGKTLLAAAPRFHPQHITLGHLIAYEDAPELFWDEQNQAPECGPCNYGDGAKRTNAKRAGQTGPGQRKSRSSGRW